MQCIDVRTSWGNEMLWIWKNTFCLGGFNQNNKRKPLIKAEHRLKSKLVIASICLETNNGKKNASVNS